MNGSNNNHNCTYNNFPQNNPGIPQGYASSAPYGAQGSTEQNYEVLKYTRDYVDSKFIHFSQVLDNTIDERIKDHVKQIFENHKKVIEYLCKKVDILEKDLSDLKQSSQIRNETKRQNLPSQYANQSSITRNQNDKFVVDIKTERNFKSFTREICESSISEPSLGRKAAQNKFFNKWNIERFICSNESVREKSPNIDPEFMTDEVNGYYWAAPLDKPGYYMVYPDPSLSYEQSRHSSKGYKEVFKTGYQNGAYKFIPKVPAVFKKQGNQWHLIHEGELRLELK